MGEQVRAKNRGRPKRIRNKQGPTAQAPQNRPGQPPMTQEQKEQVARIQTSVEIVMRALVGLAMNEAMSVVKTCEQVVQNQMQGIVNKALIEEPGDGE